MRKEDTELEHVTGEDVLNGNDKIGINTSPAEKKNDGKKTLNQSESRETGSS